MKVLIVEDEKLLSKSIAAYLHQNNFICDTAIQFHEAREKIHINEYDCIVLDIALPGGSGLQLLKELKISGKADGVLIISARNAIDDRVAGLEAGADDYLTKPFHLAELSARISSIIRRRSFNGSNTIVLDKLTVNILDRNVKCHKGNIDLTKKEYELLLYFISNKNRVLTKESIIEHLWGDDAGIANNYDFIYTHIKNLRRKLEAGGCPEYIKAVYGMGYKFSIAENAGA
ncbi:MAG: response regulator transcription factor [Bacteroidota bacterium]|nr:response regulator transcription factor [Bacteroidota bacterium]